MESELEGVWKDGDGLTIAFEGDAARLISFGVRVTGRQFFDVGGEYITEIERVDRDSFVGRRVHFQVADGSDGIVHIQGVSRTTVVIDATEFSIDVTDVEGVQRFEKTSRNADAYEYGGACETMELVAGAAGYGCDDSGTASMCTSLLGLVEFWENATCRQLGYAYEYAPAEFRHDAGGHSMPGAHGNWGDQTGGSGAGFRDGSGGGVLQGGPGPVVMSDAGTSPSDAGVTNPDSGVLGPSDASTVETVHYLVYGVVWDSATRDCPEGSGTFDDAQAYYWQIVAGEWSDTYETARAAIDTQMRTDYPTANAYNIQSSWFTYGRDARHAVVIEYTHDLAPWDCRARIITVGYGTSYEAALASAIESKDNNDSASAPYTELEHITW